MTHTFRICPTNRLIIEWRADNDAARWCFFKVCDSPNDAQRSLLLINGGAQVEQEQLELMEVI